jgi:hypothetical protein
MLVMVDVRNGHVLWNFMHVFWRNDCLHA